MSRSRKTQVSAEKKKIETKKKILEEAKNILKRYKLPGRFKKMSKESQREILKLFTEAARIKHEKGPTSDEFKRQMEIIDSLIGYHKIKPKVKVEMPPKLPLEPLSKERRTKIYFDLKGIFKEKGSFPKPLEKAMMWVRLAANREKKEFKEAVKNLEKLIDAYKEKYQ